MKRIAALVLLLVLGSAAPAGAGGSNWEFDAQRYQPGDRAFAWASVAWEHNDDLGTPGDGPYGAWLWRFDPTATANHPYGTIPDDAIRVADVVISLEPYDAGGVRFGPHHATVEFVVPGVPPGQYELLHCNDPCTTTLGDITFGSFQVVGTPGTTTTTTTSPPPPPTTLVSAAPLVADDSGDGPPAPLLVLAGAAGVVLVGGLLLWLLRGQPTVKPT